MTVREHDYLIIGAGPAGLQLAYCLSQAKLDYAVLEANESSGSFFRQYPKHRKLLSINKIYTGRDDREYNLRHDWNSLLTHDQDIRVGQHTKSYFPDAGHLADYLERFASELALEISYGVRVERISRGDDGRFTVETSTGEWRCRRLVIATGIGKPFVPDIPGIDLARGYEDISLDADELRNKSVLILGKGNSALETAEHLLESAAVIHLLSPRPVRLAWDTRHVGDVRAVNNNFLDTYHLKSQNAVIDGVVHEITEAEDGRLVVKFASIHCPGETEQITYDCVLRCTGFRFDESIFEERCRPAMRSCGRLPLMTPSFESTSVPELFFAGASMQALDYKKGQSAFIHGFRYNVRTLAALLANRYGGEPLPATELERGTRGLARAILTRMSSVSSLWQQVGFLCDVLIDATDDAAPQLVHDLPYGFATSRDEAIVPAPSWRGHDFYVVCFRFGEAPDDVFDHPRSADLFDGATSVAIHPVVERWRDGRKVDEFHVLEDFAADWTGEEYVDSLSHYFDACRAGRELERNPQTSAQRDLVRSNDMRLVR